MDLRLEALASWIRVLLKSHRMMQPGVNFQLEVTHVWRKHDEHMVISW